MKIRYFGHSAFEIVARDATLLFDPFITGNGLAEKVVTANDLNPDVILLTHAHGDHWGDTMSIAKRTGAMVVSNFEITQYVSSKGHANVLGMNTGGSWRFEWGRVIQTIAHHSSSFPDGTYGGNPNGFIVHADDKCIYALGDTSAFSEMEWIGEDHDIDVALVPIGDCFTMGPKSSLRAIKMLKPALTVPIHYNTFPPIEVDVDAWAASVEHAGFVPRVLTPGETLEL